MIHTTEPKAKSSQQQRKTRPADEKPASAEFDRKHHHQIRRSNLAGKNPSKQQNTQQMSRDPDLVITQPKCKQKRTRSIKKTCETDKNLHLQNLAENSITKLSVVGSRSPYLDHPLKWTVFLKIMKSDEISTNTWYNNRNIRYIHQK